MFKQIAIAGSDDDESEEEYIPPKNFEKDSDDNGDSTESSEEDGDSDDACEELRAHIPEPSKLSRERKIKTSGGKYKRKATKVATNKMSKGPTERLREFPDNGLTVINGKLGCQSASKWRQSFW